MTAPETPAPATQTLPNRKGKMVQAPVACETCGDADRLDENHQGAWLCGGCMAGAVDFGMGQMGF